MWNTHQWCAKGNIIYILQVQFSRLALSNLGGTELQVLRSFSVNPHLKGFTLEHRTAVHLCDHADMQSRALCIDYRACSITAPTHACLAAAAALPQGTHPFISIFKTPADKSSHCVLKLQSPIQDIRFSHGGKLVIKETQKDTELATQEESSKGNQGNDRL